MELEPGLMRDAVVLMIYGMSVVFIFLLLLVGATGAMSKLIQRFFPEAKALGVAESEKVDALTEKIIQAAIDRHRRRR